MKSIRRIVTCLCLVTTLAASAPLRAEPGAASPDPAPAAIPKVSGPAKLDLSQLKNVDIWTTPAPASSASAVPLKANLQASGGSTKMSAAKKTWIIIGCVVGAALVVAAVSSNGSGSGGGGY